MPKHTFTAGFTTDFEYIKADRAETQNVTLIYTHGFCADPWGRKPEEIKKWCSEHGVGFFRYELAGHGSDAQNIEKADFNTWKSQLLEIIDQLTSGPLILAGASLGGWLSLVAATRRPERVKGLLGLAAAPDFTKDNAEYATDEQKEILERDGKLVFEEDGFRMVVTRELIETGNQNLLLDKPVIPINCPVVLIQGMEDNSVHWPKAVKIAEKIQGRDVLLKLIKDGDHRLNSDKAAAEIRSALTTLLHAISG